MNVGQTETLESPDSSVRKMPCKPFFPLPSSTVGAQNQNLALEYSLSGPPHVPNLLSTTIGPSSARVPR